MDPAQSQPVIPAVVITSARKAADFQRARYKLTKQERYVVGLAAATWRHDSAEAARQQRLAVRCGVSPKQLDRIRWGGYPGEARMDALVAATRLILGQGGRLSADDRRTLNTLGIDRQVRQEIITQVGATQTRFSEK